MRVLFVCRFNVGRSQMAAALYNKFTKSKNADSAGTQVENPGQTILERTLEKPAAQDVIDAMKTEDIDVSECERVQIDQGMMNKYDVVVNMAEKEYSPDWLLESLKCIYWDIKDPRHLSYEGTLETKNEIKKLILALIGELSG